QGAQVRVEDGETRSLTGQLASGAMLVTIDGTGLEYAAAGVDDQIWLAGGGRTMMFEELTEGPVRPDDAHSGDAELTSPMPGTVVAIGVTDGDAVETGTAVVAVEAMKMEHSLRSPVAGVVQLLVAVGDQVKVGQPLARIAANVEGVQS
ncbi:MAG: acetyl-CoA carboxylase biotin carboxyl carrier protein subunit, partial [Mycobacterium sp.]